MSKWPTWPDRLSVRSKRSNPATEAMSAPGQKLTLSAIAIYARSWGKEDIRRLQRNSLLSGAPKSLR